MKLQIDYVFNLFYTTGYPLSRISLVLLYRRIFVQLWFHIICWMLIGVFSGYMISTVIVDSLLKIPVNAYWDHSVPAKQSVDLVKLYIANAAFNIATDTLLFLLPLTIIWRLSMTPMQKIGLTAIFGIGALTLVASIARLVYFYQVDPNDISYSLVPIVFWTSAELFLGILCPCVVTFRPLMRTVYRFFTSRITTMRKGSSPADGVEHYVGLTSADKKSINGSSSRKSSEHQHGPLDDRQHYPMQALSRDEDGMAVDQNAALARLDPRVGTPAVVTARGTMDDPMPVLGTSAQAKFAQRQQHQKGGLNHHPHHLWGKGAEIDDDDDDDDVDVEAAAFEVPKGAIGVQRDYKLENHNRYQSQ
ncbi:MAG: hypothetical protein Q9217_005050 [Psora testacea]